MRAKFVPAEMLYPSATQNQQPDAPMQQAATFGTVDYSAFSQPPTSTDAAFGNTAEPVAEVVQKENSDYGSDFQIPTFDPSHFVDDIDQDPFLSSFNYKANGSIAKAVASVPSSSTKDSTPEIKKPGVASKFGFNYESLADNIEELELINNSKELNNKFSQAKYQNDLGNHEEANKILTEMMNNQEIRYKHFTGIENGMMSTFAPISE